MSMPKPAAPLLVALVVAMLLTACTRQDADVRREPPTGASAGPTNARADEPLDEGLREELEEQTEEVDERLEALEEARSAGDVGVIERVRGAAAPGWLGEEVVNREGNDWEPAVAADPNAPYVYILHNRYGGQPACENGCPDPAMILHVSEDNGQTWRPERYLCTCRDLIGNGQFDPLIEVVPDTGDVVAVWMNGFHVFFSRSTDHGVTWSAPASVFGDLPWQDKPNMALSDDGNDISILVNGPTGGDVWAGVSHDGGATWTHERVTNGDRYFFDYGGVVLPDGRVVFSHISFSYTGEGGDAVGRMWIHVISSDDGGDTWAVKTIDKVRLGTPCTTRGCYRDFHDSGPVLAWTGDENLVIVYNGARRDSGPQHVYARSSTDGGRTWGERLALSEPGANAAYPAAVGDGDGGARLWFMQQRGKWWNTVATTTPDGGSTWTERIDISDADSGTVYTSRRGVLEVYGDYGEIAITSDGDTFGAWGEGVSYFGPGGVWYNRER
jgi:hypothetical protein